MSLVEGFSISLSLFKSPTGEEIYNPTIDLWVDQDDDESRPVSLITEIYAPTIEGAIYAAYRTSIAFSDQYHNEVLVFDEAGECIEELNLTEILDDIHDAIEAHREEIPENAIIH